MASDTSQGGSGGAQDRPQFVIEKGNRFYLTAAVYAYDPDAPDATQEQKDAVAQFRRMIEDAANRNQVLRACEIDADVESTDGINTESGINTEGPDGINTEPDGINTEPDGINTGSDPIP